MPIMPTRESIKLDEPKRTTILKLLENRHNPSDGGWWCVYDDTTIPGYVVVASDDYDGSNELHIYKWADLEASYDKIMAAIERERIEDTDWDEYDLGSVVIDMWWDHEYAPEEASNADSD